MDTAQEFKCIFCKELFENKEELQIHFRKHGDPKFHPSLKHKARPQNEMSSEKSNDASEMVNCDVCSEVFPTISKAITHKHKVHPEHDAKHFCPWCGKLFTMKHLYNKHMKASHGEIDESESGDFHCDCCDVTFHIPSAMLYHNKFFHRQDTDLPSVGQSKKLKMINQEVVQIYYCSFCGEEYNNKVNLHKHIGDDHGDENHSPDDVMRCPLCDAIFYHLDAYELHLTFHSIEDTYSEKNDMVDTVTEFSLEAVPPIMERVENCEPTERSDGQIMGIEDFLQIAMDNPVDEDNPKLKSKKHKKHKKSKKAAITLDEFLNMNKDVFGEGLDFQGIEEVPSRVVAKRLKVKKQPGSGSKGMSPNEVEKLRKQGIVVKMKSTKNATPVKKSVASKKVQPSGIPIPNAIKSNTQSQLNVVNTSSDVLSKLLNQSNSQIKIVRKPAQENMNVGQPTTTTSGDEQQGNPTSPENIQAESDVLQGMALSETDTRDKINYELQKYENNMEENSNKLASNCDNTEANDIVNTKLLNPMEDDLNFKSNNSPSLDDLNESISHNEVTNENVENVSDIGNGKVSNSSEAMTTSYSSPLSALRNVRQHITVKPVVSSKGDITLPSLEKSFEQELPENKTLQDKIGIKNTEQIEKNKGKSINALKHLSHLTVKSVNHTIKSPTSATIQGENNNEDNSKDSHTQQDEEESMKDGKDIELTRQKVNVTSKILNSHDIKESPIKSLNAFKNISKNITIKSLTPNAQSSESIAPSYAEDEEPNYAEDEDEEEDIDKNMLTGGNKNEKDTYQNKSQAMLKVQLSERNTAVKVKSPMVSPKLSPKVTNEGFGKIAKNTASTLEDTLTTPSKTDILKHLTNITAKSIGNLKNTQTTVTKSSTLSVNAAQNMLPQKQIHKEGINDNIEIFNIDDSESDNEDYKQTVSQTYKPENLSKNAASQPIHVLKNINKNITIKNTHQQTIKRKNLLKSGIESPLQYKNDEDSPNDDSDGEFSQGTEKSKISNLNVINEKHQALQNTLKNLSRHLTIKSRNSSPSSIVAPQDQNTEDSNDKLNDPESDSDTYPGRVKIAEVNDDHIPTEEYENASEHVVDNVIVQSPHNSGSDNDDNYNEEPDEEFSDIDSKIKTNTLNKLPKNLKLNNDNLKNISKDITIKSLNDRKSQSDLAVALKGTTHLPSKLGDELSIKPFNQGNKIYQENNETPPNRNNKVMGQQFVRQQSSNQSINQKVSTSTNQMNTVNKEVTVKTFQTKTIIQEITTTVTKTIKTVNQTMKQEVQASNQASTAVVPQKVQGMRPSQPINRNYQGVVVRHASPAMGTKVRNAMTPIRPANPVKTSNQLVPIRPGVNVRACNPRLPSVKSCQPSTSSANNTGKPIKIAPNVSNATSKKRPQEPSGPFSCFKKPKESLIPVSEVPNLSSGEGGDSTIYFASSSQMSKSNVMNMTKAMKGSSVVSSTQMKSEIRSSSQQLSRLNSVSGLKVVKTSHVKQAAHVEEKNQQVDATKRTTLAAIEKLQKQGLLVKKPRLEANDFSDHSDGEDFDNFPPEDDEYDD